MKSYLLTIFLFAYLAIPIFAQTESLRNTEQEIIQLSMDKWQWMADKDIEKLTPLFHTKAKFVHMSGTWTTPREFEIIETGSIWYKQADIHDTAVEMAGNTAIVWNRITLHAVVRENEVSTEFTVTEVYQKEDGDWKMLALTFSSVRDTHTIEKYLIPYKMIRMSEAPKKVEVHFVKNDIDPTGLGEPLFPPVFATVCNALYKATGRRLYNQPFKKELESGIIRM